MRRPTALFTLTAFLSLTLSQAGGACAMADGVPGAAAAAMPADHSGHAGHEMPVPVNDGHHVQLPDSEAPHAPACLMLGPCVALVAITVAQPGATTGLHADSMVGVSDRVPTSLTTAPESPPPRT